MSLLTFLEANEVYLSHKANKKRKGFISVPRKVRLSGNRKGVNGENRRDKVKNNIREIYVNNVPKGSNLPSQKNKSKVLTF